MAEKRKVHLRGRTQATVDEQGRLKIPTMFKDILVRSVGDEFFVTSLTGDHVWVYPLTVWEAHEKRLTKTPRLNPHLSKYLYRVNYHGMEVKMDKQGRILIPATLRASAAMRGELRVLANIDHLEVWNEERITKLLASQSFTDEDLSQLADLGI